MMSLSRCLLVVGLGLGALLVASPCQAAISGLTDVDNLLIWLDANDPDGDGTPGGSLDPGASGTATWVDKAPDATAHDASQDTTSKQPTLVSNALNSLPVVRFDGGDSLTFSSVPAHAAGNNTVIAVAKSNDTSGEERIINFQQDAGSRNGLRYVNDQAHYLQGASFSEVIASNAGVTSFHIISGRYDGLAPLNEKRAIFVDSASAAHADNGSGVNASVNNGYVGSYNNTGSYLQGDIAELLVYDRALSEWELNRVGYYLQDKWGIESTFVVPEPATLLIWSLLAGLGVGLGWRRRK